jgi:DEAD/DEAH box helicase domain-containing protein
VTGYQKRGNGTNKLITSIPLDLPELIIETEGFWIEIPQYSVNKLEESQYHFMGGLHAFEHVMISIFPLLVLCDRNDVGGISCPHHEQTNGATIFIYDGHPGGSGLSREAYRKAELLIRQAHEIVRSCACDTGCPSCVHSPKCGSGNRPIDKAACLQLIANLLVEESDDAQQQGIIPINELASPDRTTIELGDVFCVPPLGLGKRGIDTLPNHFGIFDLETKYSAEEVGGWDRAYKMGISVGVVYDSILEGYVTYLENEIDKLVSHLQSLELVVGFNNKRFDNRVLSAYTDIDLSVLPTLDLLEEVTNQLGYRLSLNSIAEHTLGLSKGGDGLQALQWYRQGEIQKLCQYCKKDVEITKDLLLFALENGFLLFQNKAGKKVRLPLVLDTTIGILLKASSRRHDGGCLQ